MELYTKIDLVKSFFYGIGLGSGVFLFLFGLFKWFVKNRIEKWDGYLERIEKLERDNAELRAICRERHNK